MSLAQIGTFKVETATAGACQVLTNGNSRHFPNMGIKRNHSRHRGLTTAIALAQHSMAKHASIDVAGTLGIYSICIEAISKAILRSNR